MRLEPITLAFSDYKFNLYCFCGALVRSNEWKICPHCGREIIPPKIGKLVWNGKVHMSEKELSKIVTVYNRHQLAKRKKKGWWK